MTDPPTVPRGRHAPPLEVRQSRQRGRLFRAAATVFARVGYADATAEAIAREAGMSKATFYEHFDNKEECMLALFDAAAAFVRDGLVKASEQGGDDPVARLRASINAFLDVIASFPDESQTLLVEIIGAGPRAAQRRDEVLTTFANVVYERNAEGHRDLGIPRLPSWYDAFAIVGAITELASRQVRLKDPADIRDLEPVVERMILGVLAQSDGAGSPAA